MTPSQLTKAAHSEKCVVVPGCIGRIPAAWFAHMQWNLVMRLLPDTKIYNKRKKDKWSPAPWKRNPSQL